MRLTKSYNKHISLSSDKIQKTSYSFAIFKYGKSSAIIPLDGDAFFTSHINDIPGFPSAFSKANSSNLYEIRLDISAEHLTQLSSNAKNVLIRTKTNEQIEKVLKIISTTNFENQDKIITILFESEIDENLIKLCKKLDINLCLNVKKDFKSNILPLGKIVRSDVKLSFNFEESINPFEFISFYACATNPDAKLSVYELLRSLSFYGYEQCNEEKKYGSLENGKIANMLILSNSPYSVSKDKISTLKIEEIYSNGQHFELKRNSKFDKIKKIVYNKTKS